MLALSSFVCLEQRDAVPIRAGVGKWTGRAETSALDQRVPPHPPKHTHTERLSPLGEVELQFLSSK